MDASGKAAITEMADRYGVDVNLVRAVIRVEAIEHRLSDGRLKILFEPHIFYRLTNGRHGVQKPISAKNWAMTREWGYGTYSEQYRRRLEAVKLDKDAAFKACSYGPFQLLGMNYAEAGYANVFEMVEAFEQSDAEAVRAIFHWWGSNGALKALQAQNISKFARIHNGIGHEAHDYVGRIKAAWSKLKKEPGKADLDLREPRDGAEGMRKVWNTTLSKGDAGYAVVILREHLDELGYDVDGPGPSFGPKTEAAVKAFQKKQAIRQDGIVGPQTWAELDWAIRNQKSIKIDEHASEGEPKGFIAAIIGAIKALFSHLFGRRS